MDIINRDAINLVNQSYQILKKFYPSNSFAELLGLLYGSVTLGEDAIEPLIDFYLNNNNSKVSQEVLLQATTIYSYIMANLDDSEQCYKLLTQLTKLQIEDVPEKVESLTMINNFIDMIEAYAYSILTFQNSSNNDQETHQKFNLFVEMMYENLNILKESIENLKFSIADLMDRHKTSPIGAQLDTIDGLVTHGGMFNEDELETVAFNIVTGEIDFIEIVLLVDDTKKEVIDGIKIDDQAEPEADK